MATINEGPGSELNLNSLLEMNMSFAASRVLAAGVQLDIFSHIEAGYNSAAEVAHAAEASERGMSMLLDALTVLQLLNKSDGKYELTPLSAKFLVRASADYAGAMMENDMLWEAWGKLVETIRTGRPSHCVEPEAEAEKFFPALIRSLHVLNREPARKAAQVLRAGVSRHGLRVVDVGCGSGVWGIGIAEADKEAHITAQDFAGVLEHTGKYLRRYGVEDRFDFLSGDLKEVDFGKNRFDLALLGNIVHSEGERSSRDLFQRLYRALTPGGQIAIADMIPNDERTGPPFPIIFALNMLVNTEVGATFTLAEYTMWLTEAGFAEIRTADIESHSPLIIASKS